MKEFPTYISHNQYGYANPSAISTSSNKVVFDLDKVSQLLREKVYGQIGIVYLTKEEVQEIFEARTEVRRVGDTMMQRIGMK